MRWQAAEAGIEAIRQKAHDAEDGPSALKFPGGHRNFQRKTRKFCRAFDENLDIT